MGKFKPDDVERLLVGCHRCCCICHRFCGVKIEIDHIDPQAEGGSDSYDNAIPLCFECHAEVHSYNPKHPRGRKYQSGELRAHRDQWLAVCATHPEIFRNNVFARAYVGPLESLIDELEFNEAVTAVQPGQNQFCPFKERQFLEAIRTGSIATLQDELKRSINAAYVNVGQANHLMTAMANTDNPNVVGDLYQRAVGKIMESRPAITKAKNDLAVFLGNGN